MTVAPLTDTRGHRSEPFPLDAFPSLHGRYREAEPRLAFHPFGREGQLLPFLLA